jgi:protein tyrosine phosphatase
MNKYRITNPYNNIVRDCKSRTTEGDMTNASHVKLANSANFYILSRKQGLTQYYPGRTKSQQYWSKPGSSTPASLRKHIKN